MAAAASPWRASPILGERMRQPRNLGSLPMADGYAWLRGACGDEMAMWVCTEGERIAHIRFRTSGCGTSHGAGSMATELAAGRRLLDALHLEPAEVLAALGGLPTDHEHCAHLAATTVQPVCEDVLVRRLTGAGPHRDRRGDPGLAVRRPAPDAAPRLALRPALPEVSHG